MHLLMRKKKTTNEKFWVRVLYLKRKDLHCKIWIISKYSLHILKALDVLNAQRFWLFRSCVGAYPSALLSRNTARSETSSASALRGGVSSRLS